MSKISLSPDASGTGIFTIASPNSNTNRTLTLPDADGTVSLTNSDGTTVISVDSTDPALRITQVGTGNALVVEDEANPDATPFVINQLGKVVVGDTTAQQSGGSGSPTPPLQVVGNTFSTSALGGFHYQDGAANASMLSFNKSRGTSLGTQAVVQDGDRLGGVEFTGSDGTSFISATRIESQVDGTPGTSDVPGRILFSTRPTGGIVTERMRITSTGEVLVGGTTEISGTSGCFTIERVGQPILALYRNDTSIVSPNILGTIEFYGNDTTSNTPTKLAYIQATASGTHVAGDNPTDLVFGVTADGTETVFEALRITESGTLDSQDTYDNTQSGSTVVVTSAGLIGRTSSSIKYKKDVETLDAELVDNAISNLRPVWYRTKDAKGDDKETWSHIGLIAEEVHEIEPRLVRYRTEKVEFVDVEEQVTKTREVSPAVTDEEGNVVQEAVTEEYTETVTRKEKQKTPLDIPEPEDVDYGRLAVLCLAKIQQQEQTIAALEVRIAALEGQ